MSSNDLPAAAVEARRAGIEKHFPKAANMDWQIPTQLVLRLSSAPPRGSQPAGEGCSNPGLKI
jgi:hypothetical protein